MDVKLCRDETIVVEFIPYGDDGAKRIYSIDIPFECKELDEKYPEARGLFYLKVVDSNDQDIFYYVEDSIRPRFINGNIDSIAFDILVKDIIEGLSYEINLTDYFI